MTNAEKERRTEEALKLSSLFEELDGRRPRLLHIQKPHDEAKIDRALPDTCHDRPGRHPHSRSSGQQR